MPGLTPNQNYPYPLDTELHDVAGDLENLAMAVDSDIADALATVASKVDRAGDTMSGMLSLPGSNPTSLNHAARKGYVDDQMETRVAVAGDAMTGELAMGGNKISGLALPTGAADAARKSYVDDAVVNAVRTDLTSTQIMAGPLRSPRFTLTDTVPDNPDEVTSKEYVDGRISSTLAAMNLIFQANLAGQPGHSGLLIQGAIAMVTFDAFAGSVVEYPVTYYYNPIVLAVAANASQSLFIGVEHTTVTAGQCVVYARHISSAAPAIGATGMYYWLAVGFAAEVA